MLVVSGPEIRPGESPRNPAKFLDSSLHSRKRLRAPVIGQKAVEFKLVTTADFPWRHHRNRELRRGLAVRQRLTPGGPSSRPALHVSDADRRPRLR